LIAQARGGDVGGLGAEALDQQRSQGGVGEGLEGEPGTPERGQQPHDLGRAEPKSGEVLPSLDGGGDQPKVERSKAVATATACAFKKRPMA
jgi:hypothetical protein